MPKGIPKHPKREICFCVTEWNWVQHRDTALLITAVPFPRNDLEAAVEKELKAVGGPDYFLHGGIAQSLAAAIRSGRSLMGWSSFRSKERTMTWQQWDAFITEFLGVAPNTDGRPEEFCLDRLSRETNQLIEAGRLTLVGRLPGSAAKPKPKRREDAVLPKRKRRRADDDNPDNDGGGRGRGGRRGQHENDDEDDGEGQGLSAQLYERA